MQHIMHNMQEDQGLIQKDAFVSIINLKFLVMRNSSATILHLHYMAEFTINV